MHRLVASQVISFPVGNRILTTLPQEEYERLLPNLSPVRFPQGRVLWNMGDTVGHAFFPLSGMVSLLSVAENGSTIEVGMIGNEGLAGISSILRYNTAPYKVMVQLPVTAMRIRTEVLKQEFNRGGRLQDLLLRYTHVLLTQVSQSAACNRFHTTEKRLCRWLLIGRDRINSDTIHFTQEFLSHMLGVPRTSVTAIAAKIQRLGLISYGRGKIKILDARGLEQFSCECYRIVRDDMEHYLVA